ncbi:hypothetical protein COCNU_07G010520 [Cocos nucifera]|uniref:Uncharacterized protein n=1 Tax=Cocos nucifera TaxID=13894 RepID=A0A8K0IFF0_COCNU|nr:hypothetical protein COCNU_07G010520 [Cocos nucifera]
MKAAFRTAIPALLSSSAAAAVAVPPCFSVLRLSPLLLLRSSPFSSAMANHPTPPSSSASPSSSTTAAAATLRSSSSFSSSMEKQFEDFRVHLEESGSVRERIRGVVMEMEGAIRLMHSSLLLVHQSLPAPEVLEKTTVQIGVLKDLFGRLAEILRESPGQYYRIQKVNLVKEFADLVFILCSECFRVWELKVIWTSKIENQPLLLSFGESILYNTMMEFSFAVAQLQKMLNDEEKVHEVLERALLPQAARHTLHIPSFLPKKAKELLAELVMVEEEIARLEDEISRIQQGLNSEQEAQIKETSISNPYKQINDSTVSPLDHPPTTPSRAPSTKVIQEKVAMETKPMFFINQAIKGDFLIHGFTNEGDIRSIVRTIGRKENQRVVELKERVSMKSGMIEKASMHKLPPRHPTSRPSNADADMLLKLLQEPSSITKSSDKEYQKCQPNKLSEKIMKCLICIFLRLIRTSRAVELEKSGNLSRSNSSFLRSGSFRADGSVNLNTSITTQRETRQQDPYGIFEIEGSLSRDIGPYKNLVKFTLSSLDLKGISTSLSLLNQLSPRAYITYYFVPCIHGFLEHGLPSNPEKVLGLKNQAVLNVGGNKLNALAIEHFILRQPSSMKEDHWKGEKDDKEEAVRSIYGLEHPEPNIIFALCSGNKSSPAVKIYTSDNVLSELEKSKLEYLQASIVVTGTRRLMIPELLFSNMHDFAANLDSLVDWICNQLPTSWSLRKSMVECLKGKSNGKISDIVDIMPCDLEFQYLLPM